MFFKPVDLRSQKAMVEFLSNHFRYNTMNSWNNSTSYANNIKKAIAEGKAIPEKVLKEYPGLEKNINV